MDFGSKEVAAYAIRMATSIDRNEEKAVKQQATGQGIKCAAVDFGGDFLSSVNKIIERTVVAAKREGLINDVHNEEGAVAGAAREAIAQITAKAIGLNIGGKIGISCYKEHVSVAMFFGIGLLHLNEISIGLGHRAK